MKRTLTAITIGVASLFAPLAGQAHQIWFERDGSGITFRYGELDVNMHEVSPGGLDRFKQLQATWLGARGEQPLALEKQRDRLALPPGLKPAPGDSFIAVDKQYPMFDTQRDGKALRTWWTPATRWIGDFSARKPMLTLDIVPTGVKQGAGKVQFQVVYQGEPLAGQKLNVATPAGWVRTATSDTEGKFSVALPWRGNYAIGLYFVDDVSGERKLDDKIEKYQLEGYNTALSFYVARGLAPLPVADETLPASVRAERGLPQIKH